MSYNLGLKQQQSFVQAVSVPGVWGSQISRKSIYESWNFNSGNYLFTTDTK